jgi:transmembrane sensor
MKKMDELLAKYMLGEATSDEMHAIDEWVKTSDDNLKYFTHFKLIWETSELLKIESKLDIDESWAEFKQLTDNNQPSARIRQLFAPVRWMKVAAMWLALAGVGALLYVILTPGKPNMLALQTTDKVKTDTLPDGSVITLNKHSLINYPERFTGNSRKISLNKGEAFFDIAHDKTKPFLIQVNDAVIKVVGTSFNIKTTPLKTQVIVETGVVQVMRKSMIMRLKPKEQVDIDYGAVTITKGISTDKLYNYYRTKQLVADKTPLWRVVEVMNEAYQANIVIADKKTANRPLTTTLIIGSLDQNLDVIRDTFNVHIIHKADKIIIQ